MIRECRELESVLTSYVDGESAPPERASVEAHLDRCGSCRDRVAGERAAREVLRARRTELRPAASETLRARCLAHRRSASAPAAAPRFAPRLRRLVPLSLAATLLLAVAGVFLFGVNHEAVAAQLALDHMKCFDIIGEEGTTDPKAAAAAWQSSKGWSIGVAPSSDEHDLQLVGVRRCFSTDGAAAHCMYRWRGQALSVYIVPRALEGVGTAQQVVEKFGHGAIMWTNGPRTYLVVTRGRPRGFEEVAGYIRRNVE
jgi:anti-sigma factor RsiW